MAACELSGHVLVYNDDYETLTEGEIAQMQEEATRDGGTFIAGVADAV